MRISELRNKAKGSRRVSILLTCGLCLVWFHSGNLSWSQESSYPTKPIKIVIPNEPGGVIDLGIRAMTDFLTQELKVPMVIENRSGAGGMIGAADMLKAKPDGYTLLAAGDGPIITAPLASPNPPYDPLKDFLPLCSYGGSPMALGVVSSSPIKTLGELVKGARDNPGKLTIAITVFGGENHLSFEVFRRAAAINIKIVPYKGTGEGIAALLGKHVDIMALTYIGFLPYVKSGEIRLLVVSSSVPGSSLPNFAEAGYPQALLPRFNGFFVSAKTPKSIHERLVPVFRRVANNSELRKKWESIGLVPDYIEPAAFTEVITKKWNTYSLIMEELGLRKKK